MFTAGNLPEEARATDADMAQWFVVAPVRAAADQHAALVLDRLYAAHPGLREWLLNGTATVETVSPSKLPEWAKATPDDLLLMSGKTFSNEADPLNYHAARVLARMPVPAFTYEPPEVTMGDRALAYDAYLADGKGMHEILKADRARAWRRFRPKLVDQHPDDQADPVRFALEKVTDDALTEAYRKCYSVHIGSGHNFDLSRVPETLRAELARILPIAAPARLALEKVDMQALCQAVHKWSYLDRNTDERCVNPLQIPNLVDELARILPVAERANDDIAELRGEIERLKGEFERLTKERDEVKAHAAKLEALMTVPGVDGPVKTWEPFDVLAEHNAPLWTRAELVLATTWGSRTSAWTFESFYGRHEMPAYRIRQTPAPEAELKRWKIANADEFTDDVEYFVSKPMTRADAEKRGKVIGEVE